MRYLVTGGCGFIGANFCHLLSQKGDEIFILDKMTYAANEEHLKGLQYKLYKGDIGDYDLVKSILNENKVDVVVNFAAETHVDNSIESPGVFIETNIIGTYNLLRAVLEYQNNLKHNLKFLHVSTDEVFGDLEVDDPKFNEQTRYEPSSPYSASKAASDHIVRAWIRTYGLNGIVTNCSNNYGLYQNEEKFIPKTIKSCIERKPITIYGNGLNIRDWIWTPDHCMGIYLALQNFKKGETYCFGGDCERTNIEIIKTICEIFQAKSKDNFDYKSLMTFIEDRKGHDFRYAIDSSKAKKELGFNNKNGANLRENLEFLINSILNNN
jgi:dTDP-glucose 4,6-dehydratase